MKTAEIDELLLSTPDGELLEGLITNVFVVAGQGEGWEVLTAPPGTVLPGIVMQRLEQACQGIDGVALIRRAPKLSDSSLWQEAFLTNSIRGIQPIGSILTDGTHCTERIVLPSGHGPVTQKLQAALRDLQTVTSPHSI
mmetsp:Transcript_35331/g.100021  ORF Transcript_35331/g.100021 Transcript_35331/m.100021 type:complete len:139 (+) Transcript_35331:365-781(+)